MKEKIKFINDKEMVINRRLKRLKGKYDRCLEALRKLVEATAAAPSLTDQQKIALDNSIIVLQLNNKDI